MTFIAYRLVGSLEKGELLCQFKDKGYSLKVFEDTIIELLRGSMHYDPMKDINFIQGTSVAPIPGLHNTLFVSYLKAIGGYEDILQDFLGKEGLASKAMDQSADLDEVRRLQQIAG